MNKISLLLKTYLRGGTHVSGQTGYVYEDGNKAKGEEKRIHSPFSVLFSRLKCSFPHLSKLLDTFPQAVAPRPEATLDQRKGNFTGKETKQNSEHS